MSQAPIACTWFHKGLDRCTSLSLVMCDGTANSSTDSFGHSGRTECHTRWISRVQRCAPLIVVFKIAAKIAHRICDVIVSDAIFPQTLFHFLRLLQGTVQSPLRSLPVERAWVADTLERLLAVL